MSQVEPTPIPWECGGEAEIALTFDREVNIYPPSAGPGEYQHAGPIAVVAVNGDVGETNADLIVRAVNCHADLLAACKGLMAFLEECGGDETECPRYIQAAAAVAKAEQRPKP